MLQDSMVAIPFDNSSSKGHPDALMIIPNSVIVPQQQNLVCPETSHVWKGNVVAREVTLAQLLAAECRNILAVPVAVYANGGQITLLMQGVFKI
jgi:hypothetical protein